MKTLSCFSKILLLFVLLVMAFSIGAPDVPAAPEKNYRIIAVQHQSMLPYDQIYKGFTEGLEKLGYLSKTTMERYNAEEDLDALDVKVAELKKNSEKYDLILALGTQSTKRLIDQIKNTPIVFTGLGDPEHSGVIPVDASGKADWKSSGANYTGIETPAYIAMGIRMMSHLIDFKKLGMVYLEGSPSHEGAIKQVGELSKNMGFEFFYEGFPLRDASGNRFSDDQVRKKLDAALGKVLPNTDVFFVQVSKTFEENFDILLEHFLENKILSSGDPLYIKKGIIMGIGKDFVEFGRQSAEHAVKIFEGTAPSMLPMDMGYKITIEINLKAASLVGYNPSVDVMGAADEIYQELELDKK